MMLSLTAQCGRYLERADIAVGGEPWAGYTHGYLLDGNDGGDGIQMVDVNKDEWSLLWTCRRMDTEGRVAMARLSDELKAQTGSATA